MDSIGYLVIVLLTLLFSALFSGTEIAYLSANKFKIALRGKDGSFIGRVLNEFLDNGPRLITTLLIGNNLALVLYSTNFSRLMAPWLEALHLDPQRDALLVLGMQTGISTLVVLLLGEYLPKALFRANPDKALARVAGFIYLLYTLLKPLVWLADVFSRLLIRYVFGIRDNSAAATFSDRDLYRYISEYFSTGNTQAPMAPDIDAEVFRNAMDFDEIRVREFMVPRTEIEHIDFREGVAGLQAKFRATELSRIIITEGSLDNIRGFVHISALFRRPQTLEEVLLPVIFVPESMPANLLLEEFARQQRSLAIAVDEFGGTAGLVTAEDIAETVFGEIDDEYDEEEQAEELLAQELGPNAWLFSARHEVEDLNERFGLALPDDEGDYTTLGGLLMHFAERIPAVKEQVVVGDYTLTVEEGSQRKIETIRLVATDAS